MANTTSDNQAQMLGSMMGSAQVAINLDMVVSHRDTIKAVLHERRSGSGAGQAAGYWLALGVAAIIAFSSSTFHTTLGIPGETISAAFLILAILSVGIALWKAIEWLLTLQDRRIDSVVEEIFRRSKGTRTQ